MTKAFALIFLIAFFTASSSLVNNGSSVFITTAQADTTDNNPNGSSELSLLMRKMYDHLAEAKKGLASNTIAQAPLSFKNINTAKPTDAETKKEYYNTFGDIYLQALETYSGSTPATLTKNYNNLVNTCLACHSSHCPGPVPKIKKLVVQ
jgi:hypothetical protein